MNSLKMTYENTRLSPTSIKEGIDIFAKTLKIKLEGLVVHSSVILEKNFEWGYDDLDEFMLKLASSYESITQFYLLLKANDGHKLGFHYFDDTESCFTSVEVQYANIRLINHIKGYFDKESDFCKVEYPAVAIKHKEQKIFIGHGSEESWRMLKDHLQDKHNFKVVAYETGARSGHSIRDILEEMVNQSSMAFLVMTGEDRGQNGKLYPRDNVVHEAGLFQGKLGFSRAIVLLEEGVEEFSNIAGIQQIRFPKGNIATTFGDVLAVIKRELIKQQFFCKFY